MDSKQAPPAYSEAVSDSFSGTLNTGYVPPAGDPGSGAPTYPAQAGYPPGYNQVPGGYDQGPTGYSHPPPGYAAPPAAGYYPPQGQMGGYGFQQQQQQQQQQTVVVTQPTSGRAVAVGGIPDHMGLAIFTTLCCCWPLGLVAIMRAQESRRALERGDLRAASTYSVEARRYSMWAIAGGCLSIVVTVVIIIVYVTSSTTYY